MNVQKTIIYIGTDEEFLKSVIAFSAKTKDVVISSSVYGQGSISQMCIENLAHIVFIDFTSLDYEASEQLLEEIIFIKRLQQYKGILFVALLDEDEEKENYSYLFSSGFQLSFIKGCETDVLMRDSFYIGFGEKLGFPGFAKVRNINKDLEIGICSTICRISAGEILVETDLEPLEGELSFKLSLFPDLKNEKFKIKGKYAGSALYPMMTTYCLEYPFATAWETETEEHLHRDTVETWLDLNSDKLDRRLGFVKIVSKNMLLVSDFYKIQFDIPFFIDLVDSYSTNQASDLLCKLPLLIFFDFVDDIDSDDNLPVVASIIPIIKSLEGYDPIIVICNHASTGSALQKMFDYQFIMVTSNQLSVELFNSLTASFISKRLSKPGFLAHRFFAPSDKRRSVDVLYKFLVTSLTEHEITFYCDTELPMFTVMHFRVPLPFYATIVPTLASLDIKANCFHYMAIIHGIGENGLMKLRQFVNQIIYRPLEDFSEEHVKFVMEQIKLSKQAPEVKVSASPKMPIETMQESKVDIPSLKELRHKIKGKSKL